MKYSIIFATISFIASQSILAETYIHAGKLITAKDQKVIENATVIIDGNVIRDVKSGYIQPKMATM